MNIREMCDEIADEFKRRGITIRNKVTGLEIKTGLDVYEFNSHGELMHVLDWWVAMFPDKLPRRVDVPAQGDLRWLSPCGVQVWTGRDWIAA